MNKPEINAKKPLTRLGNAVKYSIYGLITTWKEEPAFRQELFSGMILIPLAILLPISLFWKMLLLSSMFIVLIVELLNSAIEGLTDLVTKEHHHLAKKAKDCGSAAVFLSLIYTISLWLVVLYDLFQNQP